MRALQRPRCTVRHGPRRRGRSACAAVFWPLMELPVLGNHVDGADNVRVERVEVVGWDPDDPATDHHRRGHLSDLVKVVLAALFGNVVFDPPTGPPSRWRAACRSCGPTVSCTKPGAANGTGSSARSTAPATGSRSR